eukprot:30906-Pelagococcus_subviridis.AAC.1
MRVKHAAQERREHGALRDPDGLEEVDPAGADDVPTQVLAKELQDLSSVEPVRGREVDEDAAAALDVLFQSSTTADAVPAADARENARPRRRRDPPRLRADPAHGTAHHVRHARHGVLVRAYQRLDDVLERLERDGIERAFDVRGDDERRPRRSLGAPHDVAVLRVRARGVLRGVLALARPEQPPEDAAAPGAAAYFRRRAFAFLPPRRAPLPNERP